MTILLGMVFCVASPIIAPMCLIYFLITTCTEKYNLLYVYTSEYESGGQVSAHIHHIHVLPEVQGTLIILPAICSGQSDSISNSNQSCRL